MIVTNKNLISFNGFFVFDGGASSTRGSGKIKECDENGIGLNRVKTVINKGPREYFDNKEHLVTSIGDRICECYKDLDGKGMSEGIVFLPGATHGNICIKTPNLKDANDNSLADIDFSTLKSYLVQKGVKINDNFNLKVYQDSMGIGLSIFKKMVINDMNNKNEKFLYPGADHTGIMTGGGCGIARIQMFGENQVLIQGAGSNFLSDAEKSLRVSDIGASVKAALGEFSKWLGIPEKETKDVINAGIGEIITEDELTLGNTETSQKLKNVLKKTNKYFIEETPEQIQLKIKPEFFNEFNLARKESINKYATAIARFLPVRLAEGSSSLVLTGPFAFALDNCLKEKYNSSLEKLVAQKFVPFNSDEYKLMMQKNNFKIICDKTRFAVSDNTDCSEVLKFTKTFGERRNWLMVDLKGFKHFLKENAGALKSL